MEDYRDGTWHTWTGGDSPVEYGDLVEFIVKEGDKRTSWGCNLDFDWVDDPSDITAFRTVSDYEI
jgi:hypothetical protein